MNKQLRLTLVGLFFALMFSYAGTKGYQTLTVMSSDVGWGPGQADGRVVVVRVKPDGPASALRIGDEVVELNKQPIKSATQVSEVQRFKPDTSYSILIRRDAEWQELTLQTAPFPLHFRVFSLLMYAAVPAICLLTGFAVFLLKPHDKQALLLALMFGMAIPGPIPASAFVDLPLWLIGIVIAGSLVSLLYPVIFAHFFLVFPEDSPLLRWLPNLKFYLYLPQLLVTIPYIATDLMLFLVAPERYFAFHQQWLWLNWMVAVLQVMYITGGLMSLLMNYRQASRLPRRKMRVVVAGSLAGFLPCLPLVAVTIFGDFGINPTLLRWYGVVAIFCFTLFPLSFAYAIIRHQVIPVRLMIRRSIRYLLVARGSKLLEATAVAVVLTIFLRIFFEYLDTTSRVVIGVVSGVFGADIKGGGNSYWMVIGVLSSAISIAVWNLTSAVHHRVVAPLIDQRFFRRRYKPQQLLSELGEALRGRINVREMTRLVGIKMQEALQTESVTIFLDDDRSNDYRCATLIRYINRGDIAVEAKRGLRLPSSGYVIEQLRRSPQLLTVDFDDPDSWVHRLASANAAGTDERQEETETLRATKTSLLLPIYSAATRDQLLGVLAIGPRLGDLPFSRDDRQLLLAVVWQLALAIENAQLVEQRAEEERLRREMEIAAAVQQRLFPQRPPETHSLELAGICLPARGVGGDYYDFLQFKDDRVGIAVADVAGKGISAALLMSTVQASLRSCAPTVDGRVTELVTSMNRLLRESTAAESYATFFYAQFNERTRELTYVNAGHNPPLLLRAATREMHNRRAAKRTLSTTGGAQAVAVEDEPQPVSNALRMLTTGGPVIGVFEECIYEQEIIEMESGDLLVAYTDGITEARNLAEEEFGETRLRDIIAAGGHLSAEELSERIVERVQAWCQDAPQHDDLTLVVVKVK